MIESMASPFAHGAPVQAQSPIALSGSLLEGVEVRRLEASLRLAADAERRAELGQFFTPLPIARFMASMLGPAPEPADPANPAVPLRLLDAGGGHGALTAAAVAELCGRPDRPGSISATIWEVDTRLAGDLAQTMAMCAAVCDRAGIAFGYDLRHEDFIGEAANRLSGGGLFSQGSRTDEHGHFDVAILNPPYRKLRGDTAERALLASVGIETSNLYTAFVWLAMELLAPGGQLVAITPRSYMNGTYFRAFRRRLLEAMAIQRIHVYDSRTASFGGDDVLQENAILYAVKRGGGRAGGQEQPERAIITTSTGPEDEGHSTRLVAMDELVGAGDGDAVLHVVPDEIDARIASIMRSLPCSLADLGVGVSTGRVVDFRVRERLRQQRGPGDAPLIFPRHLRGGAIGWPHPTGDKPNAIAEHGEDDPLLLPSGWYVLVKRFSSKEERRRVVAVVFDPGAIDAERIGFDNKLNVLRRKHGGLEATLARGLGLFLNSTLVDAYFRQFSGHTQVNAGDLRSLRVPTAADLERLGARVGASSPTQHEIDELVREEILSMAKAKDPVAAKRKIADALAILKALGTPQAQQNERSALTLLALLGMDRDKPWGGAQASVLGVTPIMEWMAERYGKRYAPNTRETVRRYTLHQFLEMGLVVLNPDEPQRPTNSPRSVYQIEPSALELIRCYGTPRWDDGLKKYLESSREANRLRLLARRFDRIPVTLPDGSGIELSAGGQNVLIKSVVEEFAPRFHARRPRAVPGRCG